MCEISVEFYPDGSCNVKYSSINSGFRVLDVDRGYILIHCGVDGDFDEFYEKVEDLLKRIEECYGDYWANEVKKYL